MDVYKKRQMNRRRKHGNLSIQALYSRGRPKKQRNLCLCSGLIQGGQLGSGMINRNLTQQEILSLASENYYTKDRTWTGGEVTTGSPQTTDTKGTFNGDVAFCHSEPLFIF